MSLYPDEIKYIVGKVERHKRQVTTRVPLTMYNEIKEFAEERGRSMSWIIRRLLRFAIDVYNESAEEQ